MEGGLFLADAQNAHRVRRVSPEGIMTAVVSQRGNGGGSSGDRGPAPAAKLRSPYRLALAPDGSLYVTDFDTSSVRKVSSPLPGFAALGDIVIASRDGRELYVFTSRGKHKDTIDAITGTLRYRFAYNDPSGRLTRITDASGRITEITRTTNLVTLTGPDNQVTTVTLDGNGYVSAITNPDNDTTTFLSTAEGRLTHFTDAENHMTTFGYDANGRLLSATYPSGSGSDTLSRTTVTVSAPGGEQGRGYLVTHDTGQQVETGYQTVFFDSGRQERTTFLADGSMRTTVRGTNGVTTMTEPADVVTTTQQGADPRFGMQAPIDQTTTVTTPATPPDNLTATVTQSRSAALSNPADPFSFTTHTETVTVNGRSVTRSYDATSRTYTDTSPAARQTTTQLDANNRPIHQQVGDLTVTYFGYNANGQLTNRRHPRQPQQHHCV